VEVALSAERECRSGGVFRVAEALRSRLEAPVLCGPRASVKANYKDLRPITPNLPVATH
jgi:hypothetical protein